MTNSKERTLIRFLDKKGNSLDSIRVDIERNLYNLACQTNSEESYAHFIELCPQSRWAEEAAGRQEEIAYRQAIEKGTLQNLVFDDEAFANHRAMAALFSVILDLPPLKQALASKQFKSIYLDKLLSSQINKGRERAKKEAQKKRSEA